MTEQDVARALCAALIGVARQQLAVGHRFSCAVPGGSVAAHVFPELAGAELAWSAVDVFLVDERFVPADHADSNERLVRELWVDVVRPEGPRMHGMYAAGCTLLEAAHRAERDLLDTLGDPPRLDLAIVGVGPDGHVASLFPGHPALQQGGGYLVAVTDSPKPPPQRLSLSLRTFSVAGEIWIAAFGREKAPVIAEAMHDPASTLPVAILARSGPRVRWWLDDEAGGAMPRGSMGSSGPSGSPG